MRNGFIPVPKVLRPAIAGLVLVAVTWIATGEFDRTETVQLTTTLLYTLIGYQAPGTQPVYDREVPGGGNPDGDLEQDETEGKDVL